MWGTQCNFCPSPLCGGVCLSCVCEGDKKYYVTIRYGVVEIVQDELLYGTPDPIVEFKVDEMIFRQIALKVKSPIVALAQGEATITGDLLGFKEMMDCFETGA